jgi:DNA-binding response OmpR family regulator
MPNMTGRELIRLVRERHPDLPILRITGSDGRSGQPRIPDIVTLQKPFTRAEFTAAIDALLHRP